jgi:outer membrane immunogenic protein
MGTMKILATVVVLTLCLLAGATWAADSTYNWSGIYGGASIGYVHGEQDWKLRGSQWWGADRVKEDFTFNQFDVGAHVGAQYQWKWLVLGVEGAIFKGPHDEQFKISPSFPAFDQWRADIHTVAKAVAKVGYAYDRFLFYAKGGYAGGLVDTDQRTVVGSGSGSRCVTSEWQSGWTVGAGVEYALTKHWIIGAEYDYLDLGTEMHTAYQIGGGFRYFHADVDATEHQVLLRLSYKFDLF